MPGPPLRSRLYRQKRGADIRNGAPADVPMPEIRYDFNAELTTAR